MPLWICEESNGSIHLVPQHLVRELGRVSVMQLVTVPSYSVLVATRMSSTQPQLGAMEL